MLAKRQKITVPNFTVEALHIRMANIQYETDTNYLKQICDSLGIKLNIITTEIKNDSTGTDISSQKNKKSACFLCSWYRRKAIFKYAQDNGFTKISLGHHMDDIIHTTLLNEFYQGTFATMPAVMKMDHIAITIIRPLCLIKEQDIIAYATSKQYKDQIKKCPFEHKSNRTEMKKIFSQIERINPEARFSLWHALMKEGKLN